MRRAVLFCALLFVALTAVVAGAAPFRSDLTPITASVPPGWTRTEVRIADRGYVVLRPTAVYASLPVLVHLQGCCTTADAEANRTAFASATGPAILVFPIATDESWNAGHCCHQAQENGVDDVGFLTAVVGSVLARNADADAQRVFLSGYSNGGRMALRMACEAPTRFAAIAVYAAVDAFPCASPGPVALLMVAGTADPEIAITGTSPAIGAYTPPTVLGEVALYRNANGCTGSGSSQNYGTLSVTTWTDCPVRLALYTGGDHTWVPSAAAVIWDFFSGLDLPGAGA